MGSMLLWQAASFVFFLYILVILAWRGAGSRAAGQRALVGSLAGVAATFLAMADATPWLFTDVILPPLVLLISYWTSGLLFVAPIAAQERALEELDQRFSILHVARRLPRALAELLEAAYLGVYALVPIALVIHLLFSTPPDPPQFWAVILITDFVCFGVLPWVQTRPPRALERAEPWTSSIRALNLRLLGSTSIQVNTFPSGHAAEGLAAALLVVDAPAPIVALMMIAALNVAAGAVLGRYHYLADVFAGFVVAISVWTIIAARP
jgi:membrane-associated phospholipid phosphatase